MSADDTKKDTLNPRNRGLGRGLSALFDDDDEVNVLDTPSTTTIGSKRLFLPIEKLKPGQFQPRKDFSAQAIDTLADSIRQHGILQPILVRELDEGVYEIVAGERRWRASQQAGLHEVPVVIKKFDDATTLEIALIENLQREDLNPMEEAEAYKQLMDSFDHTQESLADSLGKSRTHIANTLRLLNLPDSVKAFVLSGKLTAGHARAVLASSTPEKLAEDIIGGDLSVREAEKRAKSSKGSKTSNKAEAKDVDTLALEKEMSTRLGTKVEIALGKKGGKLVVHYSDFDQLDEYLHRLSYNRKTA